MLWIDYVIIGVIALSAIISLIRGFVREALSLVVWFLAFWVAMTYYHKLAVYFTAIENDVLRNGAALALLFIATLIVGAIVNYLISKLVSSTGLSGTNRMIGLVFGMIRGVFIVAFALFFLDVFTTFSQAQWWQESQIIPYFNGVIDPAFEYIKETSSFLSDKVVNENTVTDVLIDNAVNNSDSLTNSSTLTESSPLNNGAINSETSDNNGYYIDSEPAQ